MNYYLSLGYLSNEGVARGNEYSAIRSNMKLNAQITSWLNVGANINFQNRTDGDIATNWESQILDNSPFTSPYNENGELVPHPMGEMLIGKDITLITIANILTWIKVLQF